MKNKIKMTAFYDKDKITIKSENLSKKELKNKVNSFFNFNKKSDKIKIEF